MNIELTSDSSGFGKLGPYLLKLQEDIGVVIDYYIFHANEEINDINILHREIARNGMEAIRLRTEQYYEKLLLAESEKPIHNHKPNDISHDKIFTIKNNIEQAISQFVSIDLFITEYKYAFLQPPHGLELGTHTEEDFFNKSISIIIGDPKDFIIKKWSDNWSNYFDSGKEWWGSFAWSLSNKNGKCLWISASTTD